MVRRLLHDRTSVAVVAGTVLVVTLALGVLSVFTAAAVDGSARDAATAAPVAQRGVVVSAPVRDGFAAVDGQVLARLRRHGPTSRVVTATARGIAARPADERAVLADVTDLPGRATLVEGRWARRDPGSPLEVTAPAAAAHAAGWQVGSRIRLPSLVDPTSAPVAVTLVGTWHADPADPVWADLPLGLTGVARGSVTTLGPLVPPEGALLGRCPPATAPYGGSPPTSRGSTRAALPPAATASALSVAT